MRDMVPSRRIHQAVDINDCVTPDTEQVEDSDADLVESISQQFDRDRNAETDEECETI